MRGKMASISALWFSLFLLTSNGAALSLVSHTGSFHPFPHVRQSRSGIQIYFLFLHVNSLLDHLLTAWLPLAFIWTLESLKVPFYLLLSSCGIYLISRLWDNGHNPLWSSLELLELIVFSPGTVIAPWFEMIPLFCSSRWIHIIRKDACISEKRQEIYAIDYLSVEPRMTTLSLISALMGQLNQITLE